MAFGLSSTDSVLSNALAMCLASMQASIAVFARATCARSLPLVLAKAVNKMIRCPGAIQR